MDEDIKIVLAELKHEFITTDEALAKIKNAFKKEMIKLLEWTFSDGYPIPEGVSYKVEIKDEIYTIPEAVEIYLKSLKS